MSAKQTAIAAFLTRFTLTEEENEALTSRDVPVGRRVFNAIDRCEQIRSECIVLSSVDAGETRVG